MELPIWKMYEEVLPQLEGFEKSVREFASLTLYFPLSRMALS